MLAKFKTFFLVIPAVIHLLPLAGVAGAARLSALYGIPVDDVNLRHRAVLFGLLGIFLLIAAFRSAWQAPVIAAALVSATSFAIIAVTEPGYNEAIGRVFTADLVAIACLAAAAVILFIERKRRA